MFKSNVKPVLEGPIGPHPMSWRVRLEARSLDVLGDDPHVVVAGSMGLGSRRWRLRPGPGAVLRTGGRDALRPFRELLRAYYKLS